MSFAEAVARDRASFHEEMPRATRGLEPRRRRLEGKWGTVHGARPTEFNEQKIIDAYLDEIEAIMREKAERQGRAWGDAHRPPAVLLLEPRSIMRREMRFSPRYANSFNALGYDAYVRYDRVRTRLKRRPTERTSEILFVHIPKCAGVSVRHALHLHNRGHKLLCDFQKKDLANARQIVFCTRDPFDRVVSAFLYMQRIAARKPLVLRMIVGHPRLTTFSDFVHSGALERLEAYHYFFRSQYQYLKGIEYFHDKVVHLHFERLSSDFQKHFALHLPEMNCAGGHSFGDGTDTVENREKVKSIYRADYELLPKLLRE